MDDTTLAERGEEARLWRRAVGWSVRRAAGEADVSPPTWTSYEHGRAVSELSAARIEALLHGTAPPPGDPVADALLQLARDMKELRAEVAELRTEVRSSRTGG